MTSAPHVWQQDYMLLRIGGIATLRASGWIMADIAVVYGISACRVRQVITAPLGASLRLGMENSRLNRDALWRLSNG